MWKEVQKPQLEAIAGNSLEGGFTLAKG